MKRSMVIVILLIINSIISCHDSSETKPQHIVVQKVVLEDVEDDPGPPPPNLQSKFKTLEDWLQNICTDRKPKKAIANFNFGLFESSKENIIFLVGINKYQSGNSTTTRIEFEPSNKYFKLPRLDYQSLNRQQLLDKLVSQLENFTKTDKFKKSFLAKSNTITTDFRGVIWSK